MLGSYDAEQDAASSPNVTSPPCAITGHWVVARKRTFAHHPHNPEPTAPRHLSSLSESTRGPVHRLPP